MKFKAAEKDINFPIDHYVSVGGRWEVGLCPVLYGRRVRLGTVGAAGCCVDYCAGDDITFAYRILTCVMGILLKVPEDTPEFIVADLFPGYQRKPIDKDPSCWLELQRLYDQTWAGQPVMPPPEWYVARVEHLLTQPPPTPEQVEQQLNSTGSYRDRFDELGNYIR